MKYWLCCSVTEPFCFAACDRFTVHNVLNEVSMAHELIEL
jgi:hypothetical protein